MHAHICTSLHQQLFLAAGISVVDPHHFCHLVSHFVSDNESSTIFKLFGQRTNLFLLEVIGHLSWNFGENFLRELDGISRAAAERYELNNVSFPVFLQGLRVKGCDVSIQLLHVFVVCLTDTHNDDGEWQVTTLHDLVYGLGQVVDHSICDDQTDGVLLVLLADLHSLLLAESVDVVQDS